MRKGSVAWRSCGTLVCSAAMILTATATRADGVLYLSDIFCPTAPDSFRPPRLGITRVGPIQPIAFSRPARV